MAGSFVSDEEFNLFHMIDRNLYTILVMILWRDPAESMQVMGLWLWMERVGFSDVVKDVLSLPALLIAELADEAVSCLTVINDDNFVSPRSEAYDIPLMQSLMAKEISILFFYENRATARQGVSQVVSDVCMRAMQDIMQEAVRRNTVQLQQPSLHQIMASADNHHPPQQGSSANEVSADNKTMFVTFSKGYPVYEGEVREFFTRAFGDCIEMLYMQDVQPPQQALYARITFRSASTVDLILSGTGKAKFTINGKHVWARRFVPKRPRSSASTSASPSAPASASASTSGSTSA